MKDLENHYVTRLQGIRRQGGTVQVYANIPLPLASALDLESGETVTWKVLDRTHLLLVGLPERKQLQGEATPQPPALSLVVGYCQRRAQSPGAATAAQASIQPTHVFLAVLSTFWAQFLRLNANPDLGAG